MNHQIHLIPETKRCFLEIESPSCNSSINDSILAGLTEICKSVKELELINKGWQQFVGSLD